jgi:hypothetical protein
MIICNNPFLRSPQERIIQLIQNFIKRFCRSLPFALYKIKILMMTSYQYNVDKNER